jgi:hypothetical protein
MQQLMAVIGPQIDKARHRIAIGDALVITAHAVTRERV